MINVPVQSGVLLFSNCNRLAPVPMSMVALVFTVSLLRRSLKPPVANVLLSITRLEELLIRSEAPSCSVPPPVMVVGPVYELLPESVSVPAPVLVSPPAPLLPMALAKVTSFPLVSIVPPPACSVTDRTEMSTFPAPKAYWSVPPLKLSGPAPRLLIVVNCTAPSLRFRPPLKLLFPPKMTVLIPSFVRPKEPPPPTMRRWMVSAT